MTLTTTSSISIEDSDFVATMNEDVPEKNDAAKPRRARPEIQIYRPGMMRQQPLSSTLPPEPEPRKKTTPTKLNVSTDRLNEDKRRRSSNDSESTYSYRGDDSGSTTPDAMSICSERMDRTRTFTRGGGRMKNDRHDDYRSDKSQNSYRPNKPQYESNSSLRGSRNDVRASQEWRNGPPRTPYDSTQSLYDSRQSGGYLDTRPSQRGGRFDYRSDNRATPNNRFQRQSGERSSLRAELGQRRMNGRRVRNDSINSTQSEIPMTNTEIVIDTSETQSQSGAGPDSSSSMSYYQLCKSFESMGSFDWSKEMEMQSSLQLDNNEEQKRPEESTSKAEQNQEEHAKQLQKRLAACNTGVEVQEVVRNNRNPVKGIIRLNITDNSQLPGVQQQGRPHQHRTDRYRQDYDFDDRASSISGSIAEEDECEELASGERTPTKDTQEDKRWSSRGGRQTKTFNQRRKVTNTGAENDDPTGNVPPPNPKYRGGHDYSRDDAAQPASAPRLHGRLSLGTTTQPNNDRRPPRMSGGHYQPPAVRKLQGNSVIVSPSLDDRLSRDSEEEMSDQPRQMQDFPVYAQIQQNEGPKIQDLNNTIRDLLPRVAKSKDIDAARQLVECSRALSEIYYSVLMKDLKFTFGCNLEKSLWNQGFHKIIDCMKTSTNSTHPNVKQLRRIFQDFLAQSIEYFQSMISLYETTYDFSMANLLQWWPNGLPTDDFKSVIPRDVNDTNKKSQLAIKSCSRLLISLGDLHRYQTLVNGSEDYSLSRSWYLKSVYLWPASGHAYNQLAVVAYFSMLYRSTRRARNTPIEILSKQRQERVLDEIFYSIRAICSQYPFETAKERLHTRFGAMRKKVIKYEQLLDSEIGANIGESEIAARADHHTQEIWVAVDGVAEADKSVFATYLQQNPSQLHRRVVSYLIDMAGMLSTKIGMEQFASVSERAISQLAALVTMVDSPVNAQQLIQVVVVFIYVVHATVKKGADADTISLQQQFAVQSVVSLLGALLHPISANTEELQLWLSNDGSIPTQVLRVLPAISVLSDWLMHPKGTELFLSMPSIEPLSNSTIDVDSWAKLADLANNLTKIDNLPKLFEKGESLDQLMMPESVFTASFLDIFPSNVPSFNKSEAQVSPTPLRLAKLVHLCQHLHTKNVPCFTFDETTRTYSKYAVSHTEITQPVVAGPPTEGEPVPIEKLSREALLSKEQKKRQQLFVVCPSMIVPDTNVFVDHLDKLKKILDSNKYQILICTIVMEELLGLCQVRSGEVQTPHDVLVTANAKIAVAWLKERAKEKNSRMGTLTTQGQKMAMKIVSEDTGDFAGGMVNDDRILQACTAYADRNPVPDLPQSVKLPDPEATPIVRNLVLLSEDRGICIKATTQNMPSKSIQGFIRWAKIV